MILADKIIRLRKKNGWSQEELAAKMNVSRQAVSKWEGAQTVPDLEKILQLGVLFGVTTDYLLKDEMEEEAYTDSAMDPDIRRITLSDANAFLQWRKTAAVRIAGAACLCIGAMIAFLLLITQVFSYGGSDTFAAGLGLVVLLVMVAGAVCVFLHCGFKNAPYEFIDKEPFELEYGVRGMVRERQKSYRDTYVKSNIGATVLCVLSPIPLLLGAFTEDSVCTAVMLCVTMAIAGAGVFMFIVTGVRWASMQKLLKEGDYTASAKKNGKIKDAIDTTYWLLATAVYLGWSFLTNDWHITWLVWPIAGVLSAIVGTIGNLFFDKDRE